MKKNISILISLMILITTLVGCTPNSNSKLETENFAEIISNTDSLVLNVAKTYTVSTEYPIHDSNPFVITKRKFKVSSPSQGYYELDINGTQENIMIPHIEKPDKCVRKKEKETKYDKIATAAQNRVVQYIRSSSYLKDKDQICNFIMSIEFKDAIFVTDSDAPAYFDTGDGKIYINSKFSGKGICEYVFVHELLHALKYYTHNCDIKAERFGYDTYNEVLTDLIAVSMFNFDTEVQSTYSTWFAEILPYIHLRGADIFSEYFYSDFETNPIPKNELDLFAAMFDNFDQMNSDIYYNNLIFKWYSKYYSEPEDDAPLEPLPDSLHLFAG